MMNAVGTEWVTPGLLRMTTVLTSNSFKNQTLFMKAYNVLCDSIQCSFTMSSLIASFHLTSDSGHSQRFHFITFFFDLGVTLVFFSVFQWAVGIVRLTLFLWLVWSGGLLHISENLIRMSLLFD